jgi:hypothetical protein
MAFWLVGNKPNYPPTKKKIPSIVCKWFFLKIPAEKPGHDLATEQMADDECETGNLLAGLSGAERARKSGN